MKTVASSATDYVISYFKRGSHLSTSPWRGHLVAAKRHAKAGLVPRGADACQIRAKALNGTLIWQAARDRNSADPLAEAFRRGEAAYEEAPK
jgi:hypothetical protein